MWEIDPEVLRTICHGPNYNPPVRTETLGCSARGDGECTIYLAKEARITATPGFTLEYTRQHEIGHCNGWGADHVGARAAAPPETDAKALR